MLCYEDEAILYPAQFLSCHISHTLLLIIAEICGARSVKYAGNDGMSNSVQWHYGRALDSQTLYGVW